MMIDQPRDRTDGVCERERVLGLADDVVREIVMSDLLLQFVASHIRVVRIDAGLAKRLRFGEGGSSGAGPSIAGGEVENLHQAAMVHSAPPWQSSLSSSKSWPARSAKKRSGWCRFRRRAGPRYATSSATKCAARSWSS